MRNPNSRKVEARKMAPSPASREVRLKEASQAREARRLQEAGGECSGESSKDRSAHSQRRKKKRKKQAEDESEGKSPGKQKRLQESSSESDGGSKGQQSPSVSRRARSPERKKRNREKERKRMSPKPKRAAAAGRRAKEKETEESGDEEWSPTQEKQWEQARELGIKEFVEGLSKKEKTALLAGMDPGSSPPRAEHKA